MSEYSVNSLYEKMNQRGLMKKDHFFRKDYGRVLELKIGKFKMLIGSNLLIFYKEALYPISLKMLQAEKRLQPLSCLDVWLDNVMHNVEESAICYHQNGVVKEYKLIKTEELPEKSEGTKHFDPQIVKANAFNILSFIKSSCTKEGGTYWIFKDQEKNEISLYDISSEESDLQGEEERKTFAETQDAQENDSEKKTNQLYKLLAPALQSENQLVPVASRKRHAFSFDESCFKQPSDSLSGERFCINAALAYIHLRQAVNLIQESTLHPNLLELRNYLVQKGESYVAAIKQAEVIKCAFASILYSLKFDNQKIDSEELKILDDWSKQHQFLVEDNYKTILSSKSSAIKQRIERFRAKALFASESDQKHLSENRQPLPSKNFDFVKTLCHFNRCNGQSKVLSEQEFFQMVKDLNIDDLKNQYLDTVIIFICHKGQRQSKLL